MLNVEIESNRYFKEWKLVSFSKTIKIGFYGEKKCKISPKHGRVLLSKLVIDSVKVVFQPDYMKGSIVSYSPVIWGLGNESKEM